MEGDAGVAAEGVWIGTGVEEGPGHPDIPDEGCECDQWHAELRVDPGGVGPGCDRCGDAAGIFVANRCGQWRRGPSGHRRCAGCSGARSVLVHPVEEGQQRAEAEDQGDENALVTLREHRPRAPTLPQHRREEAADEEEQRHPEAMDRQEQQPEPGGRLRVLYRPGDSRDVGEAGVEKDPEEHRHGAEGIEIVATGIGRGGHGFHSRDGAEGRGGS